jgi:subtilisin family serine protease
LPFTGRGCIVAALDFGLDFGHPNFLHPDGTTRVVSFWHQGAPYDVAHPNRYGYGRVFSPDDINAALQTSDPYETLGYHPAISDTGNGSHGTHTLDIAAGNGRAPGSRVGLAPEAALIFVHLSTPRLGIVGDLGDSVRMLEALDFVHRTVGDHPCVVNISVGREAGSHDATSPFEQAMHELLRMGHGTNRAICQSAGNYGSADLAVHGWLRDGEQRDLEWIVHPSDIGSEIDAWYSGNDRFVIVLLPPDGANPVEVKLGEVGDIRHNGALIGRIYHRKNDPNNRDNHVEVFLYRGAPAGVWILRLIGDYVITGRFHAWIERAVPGAQSHFDRRITSRRYTLGTIATSPLVITVGAYDANADGQPLAPFSSCGPTRDGRQDKPELLAPGVGVVAARSIPRDAARQEGLLIPRSGTSMATPHVTGLVAAMFEAAGRPISISEIRDCLKQSADPVTDTEHPNCCAWGRLNIENAIGRIRNLDEIPSISASKGLDITQDTWFAIPDSAPSEEDTGDSAASSGEAIPVEQQELEVARDEKVELPLWGGVPMNSNFIDQYLDRAEQATRNSKGGRRQSETSFLQQLISELGGQVFPWGLSPAALFRATVQDKAQIESGQNVLRVLALPTQKPEKELRAGDWMLRVVPGTGDVGHVAVLASGDLLSPSSLADEGIATESSQPGYYGKVIESGTFPHTRSKPFARRLLDARGRVPANAMILRPELEEPEDAEQLTPPAWLKIERRTQPRPNDGYFQLEAIDESEPATKLTPPSWLKIERRTRPKATHGPYEAAEDFVYEPTGAQTDFGPKLRKAWHESIKTIFQINIDEVTGIIGANLKASGSTADPAEQVRLFSPASRPPTISLSRKNITWRAFPRRVSSPSPSDYKKVDEPEKQVSFALSAFDSNGAIVIKKEQMLRVQDEYCEWQVFRDRGKITRVVFTSEPPEYCTFLYDPRDSSLTDFARGLLIKIYQRRCDSTAIKLSDLETPDARGNIVYNPGNDWNNKCCVHLQQPNNTLGAEINIAAHAAIVRKGSSGTTISNISALLGCDRFGEPSRASDPAIGDNVNQLARENRFITLENPVGLYMRSLDTSGWTTPDGTDAQEFWHVINGVTDKDSGKAMIVRAEYKVPASKGYAVSDIQIGGVPIAFGGHIAEHLEMRLGALVGPKDTGLDGKALALPTPVGC